MRGLTLLETLLATALLSMLMVGVLAVMATVKPATDLAASSCAGAAPSEQAIDAWVRLLAEDLGQASEAAPRENAVELSGHLAMDAASSQRTHRAVRVLYALHELDGRNWLIRRQTALDVLSNRNVQQDLVLGGVKRFELVRVDSVAAEQLGARRDGRGVWRLRVWTDEREEPTYQRLVTAYPTRR